jgi:hypothetical protein
MTLMPRMLGFLLSCSSLFCFAESVLSQTNKAKNLRREDVVIKPNRPSVYLCADGRAGKSEGQRNVLLLRVNNNTIWTIRFGAERQGTLQKLLKLPNGKMIGALTNESTAFPRYEFESNKIGVKTEGPEWGDFGTPSWLPSNTSASFSVPVDYFKAGRLFLEYKYEWEFTGAVADESHAPVHRVYFDIGDIADLSGHLCD